MASLSHITAQEGIHVRLGKRDDIDEVEQRMAKAGYRCEYAEDTYALFYPTTNRSFTEADIRKALKG